MQTIFEFSKKIEKKQQNKKKKKICFIVALHKDSKGINCIRRNFLFSCTHFLFSCCILLRVLSDSLNYHDLQQRVYINHRQIKISSLHTRSGVYVPLYFKMYKLENQHKLF